MTPTKGKKMQNENPFPTTSQLWNARYWSDRLMEDTEEAKPTLQKLYDLHNVAPLTIEDNLRIRSILESYASYSRLLAEDLAEPKPPELSRFRKFLNRIRP